MTPSEQWIFGLFIVYSIPAFILGIGSALLFVGWRSRGGSIERMVSLLSPEQTFEPSDQIPLGVVLTAKSLLVVWQSKLGLMTAPSAKRKF